MRMSLIMQIEKYETWSTYHVTQNKHMKKWSKFSILTLVFLMYIPTIAIACFLIGWLVGGNFDFTWLCLSNGCGYEATGTIGFWIGLLVGFLTLPIVVYYRKEIVRIFE